MIGRDPKLPKTKQDLYNLSKHGNRAWFMGYCQWLIDSDKAYLFDRVLGPEEPLDGGEPEYKLVEVIDEMGEDKITRHQYRYQDDPNSQLKRLGVTAEEVKELMRGGE